MFLLNKIPYRFQFYVPHFLLRYIKKNVQLNSLSKWNSNGQPVPPPHIIKVLVLKLIARKRKLQIFVETGTFMGDMVDEMKFNFKEIYSVELSKTLYKRATNIFIKNKNINILNGNSSKILPKIIKDLLFPTLFWLDAHYSGSGTAGSSINTPIEKELDSFRNIRVPHVIVIDDARLFTGIDNYPKISKLRKKYQKLYEFSLIFDMIVLTTKTLR